MHLKSTPVLSLMVVLSLGYALTPDLSQSDIQQAVAEGKAFGQKHQGYDFGNYVLYGKENGLMIRAGQGEVEAVVLGTPFERLRFMSYFLSTQRKPLTQEAIDSEVNQDQHQVRFVVFAHSPSNKEQNFLEQFGPAKLTGTFGTLPINRVERSKPSLDLYTVEDSSGNKKAEFRWLGTITYVVDLDELKQQLNTDPTALKGQLIFSDGIGKTYQVAFDLSKAR